MSLHAASVALAKLRPTLKHCKHKGCEWDSEKAKEWIAWYKQQADECFVDFPNIGRKYWEIAHTVENHLLAEELSSMSDDCVC